MSDIPIPKDDPKVKKPDLKEGLVEETFGWVRTEPTVLTPQSGETSDQGAPDQPLDAPAASGRSFVLPVSAISGLVGANAQDLPGEAGSGPVSEDPTPTLSGLLAAVPGARFVPGATGGVGAVHIPLSSLGGAVSRTVPFQPVSPQGSGGTGPSIGPSHLTFAGQPNGPTVGALTATGFEEHPLTLMVSATDGHADPSTVVTHFGGLPPGATLSVGHPDPAGGWVVPAGVPLTGLQLVPAPNWNGQGTLSITVTQPDGQSVSTNLPFVIANTPDAAQITGQHTGTTTEDLTLTTGGHLTVVDPDPGESAFVASSTQGTYGRFEIDANGVWHFALDNAKPVVQQLGATDSVTETFPVRTVDGTMRPVTVTIQGTNDQATIGGTAVGAVTEDTQQSTGGKLAVTDPDAGQASFVPQVGAAGTHGRFTLQPDGTWTYSLDNGQPAVQALKAGEHTTDTLTVSTVDGTTRQITVTINGTNDNAVIGGIDTGRVTEGFAGTDMSPDQHQPGINTLGKAPLYANGKLTIVDPDTGEGVFETHGLGYTHHGTYGDLYLQANGEWHYVADAGNTATVGGLPTARGTAIDQLGEGQTLTDTITVHSKDGTPHDIVITIHGSNDRPYCASEVVLRPGTEDTRQVLTTAQLLQNTVDVDANDQGRLVIANLHPDHGSVRNNGDGTYTFTPEKDYSGTVHFTYDVTDAHGGVTHTGATTTLAAVGDPATITDASIPSVTEDRGYINTHYQLQVYGKLDISDPDPGEARFDGNVGPQTSTGAGYDTQLGGHVLLQPDGNFIYYLDNRLAVVQQLGAGQTVKDTVTIRSVDGTTHQIEITVHGTNDAPVLTAATASATEDGSSVTGQMSATDVDTGDTLTYSLGQPAPAGFSLNADGSWSFDPTDAAYQHLAAGATEQVTIPVTVTDGTATDTQDLTITVTGTNDGPAVTGPVTLPGGTEDNAVQITAAQLLQHATDVDTGDQLSVTGLTANHGTITGDAATGFTFTPDLNYNGTVTLSYQVTDGHGGSVPQTAMLALAARDDAAIVTGTDTGELAEDRHVGPSSAHPIWVGGSLSVTDPDGPAWNHFNSSIWGEHAISDPFGGSLHITRSGNWDYSVDNSHAAVQSLAAGQEGHAVYRVTTADGTTHQIRITIHGTNDAPVLSAATASATEDGQIVAGQMSATDVDTGDTLTYSLGQAAPAGFTLNADGSWSFDPTDAAYQHLAAGATEQVIIPVTVTDGTATDTQNLTITVTGTNDRAVYSGSTTGSVTEDRLSGSGKLETAWHNIDVTDPDAGENHVVAIEVGGVLHQIPASFASTIQGTYGSFHTTHGTDGHDKWMYFADNGNPAIQGLKTGENLGETAVLVTQDGTRVPISVTIQGHEDGVVIDTPASTAGWLGEVVEDGKTHVSGQLQAHDTDTHDSVSFTPQTTTNAYGTFTVDASGHWAFALDNNAAQSMQAGQRHAMGFDIEAVSSDGSRATQHVEIFARGTNDAPVLSASTASATEGGQRVTGQMSATDVDTGDTQRFSIAQPVDGFTMNQDGSWSFDPTDAAYQNIPNGQTRDVTIAVTVTDGAGATDTRNLVITVTGTNDSARIAGVDTRHVTEDVGPGHHTTLAQISTSGTLTITDSDAGEAAFTPVVGTAGAGTYGRFTLDAQGHWTYTADNQQAAVQGLGASSPPLTDTLTITSVDGTQHTLSVTIHGTNDAPQLAAAVASATEDGNRVTGALAGTDTDTGDTLSYAVDGTTPAGFTLSPDGSWSFDPSNAAYQSLAAGGTLPVQVQLTVTDGTAVTHSTLTITVTGTDDQPVVAGAVTLPGGREDQTQVVTQAQLLGQTSDVDTGDSLSVSGVPTADHGTFSANADGSFTFHPQTNYNGPVSISYAVTDGTGPTVPATATLALSSVGDPAVITGAGQTLKEDTNLDGYGIGAKLHATGRFQVTDPDGAAQSHFVPHDIHGQLTGSYGGILQIDANGGYFYDLLNSRVDHLKDGETVQDRFTIQSVDGTTHEVTFTIQGTSDAPVIYRNQQFAFEGTAVVQGTIAATDVDRGDAAQLTYASSGSVAGFQFNADGSYTFDPANAAYDHLANGDIQRLHIPITVRDPDGLTSTGELSITLEGTNDAPRVSGVLDLGTTREGVAITFSQATLLANATDVDDGDHLRVTGVAVDAQYGAITDNGDGTFTFSPAPNYSGTDLPLTYTVQDRAGAHTTGTATLDVAAAPTPPTATQVHGSGTTHLSGTLTGGSGGWAIDNGHGHSVLSLQGQYGTLTIDPQTGHFDYHYRTDSGVIKSGGGGVASGRHTDTFHILQHGTHTSDADVQVNINVQSVHGHSGHHIDHTTLLGIDIVPVTQPQHDAPGDDGPAFEITVDIDPQDSDDATIGLSDVGDASAAERSEVADAAQSLDNSLEEAPVAHPREAIAASSQDAPTNPYLDAIGVGADPDASSQTPVAENANPYVSALGVDAFSPSDTPVIDPATLDDPMVSEDAGSDAQNENVEPDLPMDDPIMHLPEDDDPTNNLG